MQGAVTGNLRILLRAEGMALLLAMVFFYHHLGYPWSQFFWWFLAPDLAFVVYCINTKAGAIAYNTTHSYLLPVMLLLAAFQLNMPFITPFAIIWLAHIGFDRMMGYGLKYASAFADTHLGRVGKKS